MIHRLAANFTAGLFSTSLIVALAVYTSPAAQAQPVLIQSPNNVANGATSVSLTITTAKANDLLIAICGASLAETITGPTGFTAAKNQSGTPSQGIFYKVAAGTESSVSCSGGASARWGIQLLEYSAMATSSPFDAASSTTGTSATPSSGSVTTTNANDLLVAGATIVANTSFTAWTNSFTQVNTFTNGGSTSLRTTYGSASRIVTATGAYSTVGTAGASGAWIGQIAAFKMIPPILSADIVNGAGGSSVSSPSATLGAVTKSFVCQTATGTLGVSTQQMQVSNYLSTFAWTLSLAATSGQTATWSNGTQTYAFNNSAGSGCTSGQLTINPSGGTLAASSGCTNTGVSLGASTAFVSGTTNSITIASASTSASNNCYWDITGVGLSQAIPALQANGSYSINMTLTITAN